MNRIFFTALSGAFALTAWSATACETLHAYRIETDDGGYALRLNGVLMARIMRLATIIAAARFSNGLLRVKTNLR